MVLQQQLAFKWVLATSHLGASTREPQARVAVEVAWQIVSVLRGGRLHDSTAVPPLPSPL
jgi:phosphoglycerate dehydrogenase-like enzyme